MRDLLSAVSHLRRGQPLPVDLYFRLVEQGYNPDAIASHYDL
jgi:hypothetical protein